MDVIMPHLNGIEAIKVIRDSCNDHKTIILAVSASAFESEKRDVIEAGGANKFIAKPFERDELLENLQELCNLEFRFELKDLKGDEDNRNHRVMETPDHGTTMIDLQLKHSIIESAHIGDIQRLTELVNQLPDTHEKLRAKLMQFLESYDVESILSAMGIDKNE